MKTAMTKKDLYEAKYTAQNLKVTPYFPKQFQFIINMTGFCQPKPVILDLGGGTGEYSLVLQNQGYNVTLLDFSEVAIAKAKAMGVAKTICADFNSYNFDKHRFDIIFTKGFSLLNINNDADFRKCVNRIMTIVSPGGFLIYWAETDLSGTWTEGGWYNLTKYQLNLYFDHVMLFPAFRYGCRLPLIVNRLINRFIIWQYFFRRNMTVIGLKMNS